MTQFLLTVAVTGCGLFVLSAEQMPVTQQNALVQKYCAVCHTDASMNGGLSFEHFDAAHADPGDAAMMVSKLKGKALGASGRSRCPTGPHRTRCKMRSLQRLPTRAHGRRIGQETC